MRYDREAYATLTHYLNERERIRLRKLRGETPLTLDPILSQYKFTNINRSHDYTTKWLIDNWYEPNRAQPLEIQALNCAIARYFGRVEFLDALGYQRSWEPQHIVEFAKQRFREGKPVFTGAYIITNQGMTDPKEEIVVNCFLQPYRESLPNLIGIAERTRSWQAVGEKLMRIPGFGAFMAKEVLLDWQLTPLLENAVDKLTWSPAGPGAIRGLRRLEGFRGKDINKAMSQGEALEKMKDLLAQLVEDRAFEDHMPAIGREFGVTDIQFSLCEFDKYMRVKLGEGRPRSTYKPRK